jgi:hypothetical protein
MFSTPNNCQYLVLFQISLRSESCRAWWCTLGRLRQEDCELEASLCYLGRPYLKKRIEMVILIYAYRFL